MTQDLSNFLTGAGDSSDSASLWSLSISLCTFFLGSNPCLARFYKSTICKFSIDVLWYSKVCK